MRALQCPGCGHIHTRPDPGRANTFRCAGCRRLLSVPAGVTLDGPGWGSGDGDGGGPTDDSVSLFTGRGMPPAPERTPLDRFVPSGREAPPGGERNGRAARSRAVARGPSGEDRGGVLLRPRPARPDRAETKTRPGRLPVWMRGAIWTGALVVAFLVVASALRAVGILDVDVVIDVYAGSGFGRFWPLLVLIPLWAAVSSLLAHLVVEGAEARRRR